VIVSPCDPIEQLEEAPPQRSVTVPLNVAEPTLQPLNVRVIVLPPEQLENVPVLQEAATKLGLK